MASALLLLLSLLGCVCACVCVEPGSAGRDEPELREVGDWLRGKVDLIKRFVDKVRDDERWRDELEALQGRLNLTTEELRRQSGQLEELRLENRDLQTRLNTTEEELKQLKQSKAAPHVAFSASLVDSGEVFRGPSDDRTLVFKRLLSNIGDGYDHNTGVFTAPVSGHYYFSFSTFGYNTHTAGAILLKNGVRQVSTYDYHSADGSDSGANGAVLPLAAGDQVHVELWEDGRVFDNLNGHTTFSGFLLFHRRED